LVVMGTWHRPTVAASAHKLREIKPSRLAAGHGVVVEAPGPAMEAAIARVRHLLEEQ
jgi:phosphoribosylamine-glycine ligase